MDKEWSSGDVLTAADMNELNGELNEVIAAVGTANVVLETLLETGVNE